MVHQATIWEGTCKASKKKGRTESEWKEKRGEKTDQSQLAWLPDQYCMVFEVRPCLVRALECDDLDAISPVSRVISLMQSTSGKAGSAKYSVTINNSAWRV